MSYFSEKNIKKIVFASSIILVAILTVVYSLLFIVDKYLEFKQDIPKIETDYLEKQRDRLKYTVSLQVNQIDFHQKSLKAHLKNDLKARIIEAKNIAFGLYSQNHQLMSSQELQTLVLQALRPLQFSKGRGYFFVYTMSGRSQLYPPNVSNEGQLAEDLFPEKSLEIFYKLRNLAKNNGEGFLEYDWPLPDDQKGKLYRKVTYVTSFEPFDWFLGAGEYFEDFDNLSKEELLSDITGSVGSNPQSYFFIYDLHNINGGDDFATMLLNPNRPDLIGKKLSDDYQDPQGNMFRKEFLEGLRQTGDAFVIYWYKKPGDTSPKPKLSYFKLYPEWNWVVAKGIYIDDLDKIIQREKDELQIKLKNKLLIFTLILILTVTSVVLIAHYFTKGINTIFVEYKNIQETHRNELENINRDLHKRATTDNLTGLYNRQYFNERLDQEVNRVIRYQHGISLVLFDIDFFKNVNDSLGHIAGDSVLIELSDFVNLKTRQSDLLARWGGEEFVLLLLEMGSERSFDIAQNICNGVAAHNFSVERQITCSFGVTTYIQGESTTDFINRADKALYCAKGSGRNLVVLR